MDDAALKYLTHWGFTPGTAEAAAAWKQKQDFDSGYRVFHAPMVFVQQDICYDSPIDGRPITSLQARREDLARSECIPYDPEMKKDTLRRQEESQKKLEAEIDTHVEREFASMDSRKKELLTAELESGTDISIERK